MLAVGIQRQWLHPQHAGKRKRAIEMRERRTLTGWLPTERPTQGAGIDGNEQQIRHTGEMPGRRFLDLARG